jgi:hypothetical protein
MGRELFAGLMSQAAEASLCALTLGLASEPLLHPEVPSMIAAAERAGVMDTRLGTNGRALTPDLIDRLIGSGLTRLEISVDAYLPSTYAAIRPGGDLPALERAIEKFLDRRSRRGLEFPLLRLSFLVLPQNRGELDPFLERWESSVDLVSIQRPVWFPDSRIAEPTPAEAPERGWCVQPWQRLAVDFDGRLWPCCSWYGENLLGLSAAAALVSEAWRSEALESLRRSHLSGEPPRPCRECAARGGF